MATTAILRLGNQIKKVDLGQEQVDALLVSKDGKLKVQVPALLELWEKADSVNGLLSLLETNMEIKPLVIYFKGTMKKLKELSEFVYWQPSLKGHKELSEDKGESRLICLLTKAQGREGYDLRYGRITNAELESFSQLPESAHATDSEPPQDKASVVMSCLKRTVRKKKVGDNVRIFRPFVVASQKTGALLDLVHVYQRATTHAPVVYRTNKTWKEFTQAQKEWRNSQRELDTQS